VLANEVMHVDFPYLKIDAVQIVELACYQALKRIKEIIEDDEFSDSECFCKIEEIICTFEELGSNGGCRHDFG